MNEWGYYEQWKAFEQEQSRELPNHWAQVYHQRSEAHVNKKIWNIFGVIISESRGDANETANGSSLTATNSCEYSFRAPHVDAIILRCQYVAKLRQNSSFMIAIGRTRNLVRGCIFVG
jgi:hypothetical protein